MKEFRKNEQGLFICEECGISCKYKRDLSRHINIKHHNVKMYFDKWIKEENEGVCKICKTPTTFNGLYYRYKNCCSKKCEKQYNLLRTKEEVFKKFGVENVYQLKEIKEKLKQTWIKNYGVDNPAKSDIIQAKIIKTSNMKYGTNHPLASNEIQEKRKNTCFKNLGVEYPMQNKTSFEKQQMSGFKAKNFKDTKLFYRGLVELDFLEKYHSKYSDIINAPFIKYMINKKQHYYFPDFYIPSLNLIIEIKSSYYYEKYKDKCDAKEKATIMKGFNYIMIINKDYNEFNTRF